MKRLRLVLLSILVLGSTLWAESAEVLPKGVYSLTFDSAFQYSNKVFDNDGEKIDSDEQKMTTIGGNIYMGITDQITGIIWWSPGYTLSGENASLPEASLTGAGELSLSAMVQVVGEQGWISSEKFRQAFCPGVIIPTAYNYDARTEANKVISGDDYQALPYYNAFGLSMESYTDFIISEKTHLNLYGYFTRYFPISGEDDLFSQVTELMGGGAVPDKIDYGYYLLGNINYNYTTSIGEGIDLRLTLPLGFSMTPDTKVDGTPVDDTGTMFLSVRPTIAVDLWILPLPLSVTVLYDQPLWGANIEAVSNAQVSLTTYLQF